MHFLFLVAAVYGDDDDDDEGSGNAFRQFVK